MILLLIKAFSSTVLLGPAYPHTAFKFSVNVMTKILLDAPERTREQSAISKHCILSVERRSNSHSRVGQVKI